MFITSSKCDVYHKSRVSFDSKVFLFTQSRSSVVLKDSLIQGVGGFVPKRVGGVVTTYCRG